MTPELEGLLRKAWEIVDAMTPEQKEEMYRKQRDSWVRAEMSWPKAKYKWIDGVKVYDSMEDYYND